MIVRDHGRRGPRIAIRADIAQVSRSAGAVARSRPGIREQSLEWMPRRGNKFNSEFTMQNCEIICHSEEHSDEESINQQYLFFKCSPGPAAGVASLMRAGPGRKAKDLEMPITCTLFANSAADWNMQLAATRVGKEKRCSGRPRLVELQFGFSRASRSPALRRLAKLAPRTSAREHLRHRSTASDKKPVPVSLPNQNRKLAAVLQFYELQNRRKPGAKPAPKTTIPLTQPRHYAASGLLNLPTAPVRPFDKLHAEPNLFGTLPQQ